MPIPNPVPDPLLSSRYLLLAKVESAFNVDSVPVVGTDSFLCEKLDFKIKPTLLKRNPGKPGIGAYRDQMGRKEVEVTFSHEVKSNGNALGAGTLPKLVTLLQGCATQNSAIANTAAGQMPVLISPPSNSTAAAAATMAPTAAGTQGFGRYRITCILGGPSATAVFRVSGNPADTDTTILANETFLARVGGVNPTTTMVESGTPQAPVFTVAGVPKAGDVLIAIIGGVYFSYTLTGADTVTTAATALWTLIKADSRFTASTNASAGVIDVIFTAPAAAGVAVTSGTTVIALGASGATLTMTFTGSLTLGDYWIVDLLRPGVRVTPVSQNQSSLTLYLYMDGMFHKVTGARGNCKITSDAGQLVHAEFTFMGQYIDPVDGALPTSGVVFEQTDPHQFESAQVTFGTYSKVPVKAFTFDIGNTVVYRDSASDPDGYRSVVITKRNSTGGIDPEAILESKHAFWQDFKNAQQNGVNVTFGVVAGNQVFFTAPDAQVSAQNYQDRNNFRSYQMTLLFPEDQPNGNDEWACTFA